MPHRAEYPKVFCPKTDFPPTIAAAFGASFIVAIQLVVSAIVFGNLKVKGQYTVILIGVIWIAYFVCILSIKFRWGIPLLWYVIYMVLGLFIYFMTAFFFVLIVLLRMKPPGTSSTLLLSIAVLCLVAFVFSLYATKKTINAIRRLKIVPSLGEFPEPPGSSRTSTSPRNGPNRRRNGRARENSEVDGPASHDPPPIYIIAVESGDLPPTYDLLFPDSQVPTTSAADLVEAIQLHKATANSVQDV